LTIGVGWMLSDFKQQKVSPNQLLEEMKNHPSIKPLIEGGEMKEYAAHLIPEGGYKAIPQIYGEGWMIVGDSGMFVNAVHREGSNLAMTTGRIAAETVIELAEKQKPFSARNLAAYREKLDASFVMKDLKKYRNMPGIFHRNPQFFTTYPELVNRAAHTMIKVDGIDKKTKEREIRNSFTHRRSLFGLMGDAFKMWRAFE
jgi:electron transfer flavoprotein-quinone oxidoreductase